MSDIRGLGPDGQPRDIAVTTAGAIKVSSALAAPRIPIPGIGTGAAYTSGDAFGAKFSFPAPAEGTIATVVFRDYDDEGLSKEIVLFNTEFTATADNDPFAVSDVDLRNCVGVVSISTFYNFGNNQMGVATPALYYKAPLNRLFGQVVTRGADNIAVGSIPDISLVVV